MEELGFSSFNLGPEPEFFLFKLDEKGHPTLELNDSGGYFDLAPTDLGENCRRDIVLELEEMGFEIEASHHEVAPGQHEIDFKYANAIEACDNIQTFKLVVKRSLHSMDCMQPLCQSHYLALTALECTLTYRYLKRIKMHFMMNVHNCN